MSPEAVTFEHDGIVYDVTDWKHVGGGRKRVALNSQHAQGRAFVPRDKSKPVRVYDYGGLVCERSDPATLTEQFKFSRPVSRR